MRTFMHNDPYSRRRWLKSLGDGGGKLLAAGAGWRMATLFSHRKASGNEPPALVAQEFACEIVEGISEVKIPRFYRRDIGTAPGRMHEPTAGADGNLWTSPLDGKLWQYDTTTGVTHIHDLEKLTGRKWKGLHLWPIAHGPYVYLCTPSLPELYVWNRDLNRVTSHKFPHERPAVYGGHVEPANFRTSGPHLYFYDTRHSGVVKWNPESQTGEHFPCPYKLSNTLYMMFLDRDRREYWGSTWNGNDVVRFDVKKEKWTGHYRCPLSGSQPTVGGKVFGDTLYVSDILNGRIIPLNVDQAGKKAWGRPIGVPGFRDWFGYVSGGFLFRGNLWLDHSTWTGGDNSIDGEPHHFIGSWSIFDPQTHKFSRLDIPTRPGEQLKYLMSDYCVAYGDHLFILAVNQKPPKNVIVLQSKPLS